MAIYEKILNIGLPNVNNITSLFSRKNLWNYQNFATIKYRYVEKKLGLPPKPKRPLTPFLLFSQKRRPELLAQNVEESFSNLAKMIGAEWQTLNEKMKEPLREEYNNALKNYTKELMIYEQKLTEEQREMMKSEFARLKKMNEKNKIKLKAKELGKPKKPPTPFVLYMMSKLKEKPKDVLLSAWLTALGSEWNQLSESQKQEITKESKALMEQYKNDVLTWEANMLKLGHIDVVRNRALLGLKNNRDVEETKNSAI